MKYFKFLQKQRVWGLSRKYQAMYLLKKIQESLYIGQWCFSPLQSRHLGTSHSFPNHHQLLRGIFLNLWNLFPFKGDFSLGKSQSHRVPNLGYRGAESRGWFDVLPKNSAQDAMHEQVCSHDEAANHQLPIAVAFWIFWISFHGGMSKVNTKFDADLLLYSLSHFECHGLTQWSLTPAWLVQSSLFTHAHSSPFFWLPGYIDITNHSCCINSGRAFSRHTSLYFLITSNNWSLDMTIGLKTLSFLELSSLFQNILKSHSLSGNYTI